MSNDIYSAGFKSLLSKLPANDQEQKPSEKESAAPQSRKEERVQSRLKPGRPSRERALPQEMKNLTFHSTGVQVPDELWSKMQEITAREGNSLKENLFYALEMFVSAYEKAYGEVVVTRRESNFADRLRNLSEK